MSILAEIISAVLKAAADNTVSNELTKELIGISIDELSEKGIKEIAGFVDLEKSKIYSMLSRENIKSLGVSEDNLDFVIAEIQDLLFRIDITDDLLRQSRYDSANLSNILWKRYCEYKNDYIDCESEIKRGLFAAAEALIKLVRESENFKDDVLIHLSNSVDDIKVEMGEKFNNLLQIQMIRMQNNEDEIDIQDKKFQNNKKQDYLKIWNNKLFLHMDYDKRAATLADAFIMPRCEHKTLASLMSLHNLFRKNTNEKADKTEIIRENKRVAAMEYKRETINDQIMRMFDNTVNKKTENINEEYSKKHYADNKIKSFVRQSGTYSLLITGAPGIGKTSIVSWMANEYKDNENVIILRFRDWDIEEFNNGLLKAICNTLKCVKSDLENKILVLDGFDEIKVLNNRNVLLRELFNNSLDYDNLKIIITSRTNYADPNDFSETIELLPFDVSEIKQFYKLIRGQELNADKIAQNNSDVLGIPVILYMAIMSDVSLMQESTKPELYNRIFMETGGIFDRFSYLGKGYDKGFQPLRNKDNIKKYLKFLQEVAFAMFEKNSLLLTKEEYQAPLLHFHGYNISILDFPLKGLIENTGNSIEFIHKTIYEYFVSEYMFVCIYDTIKTDKGQLPKVLGELLKKQRLSPEILEFLNYRIRNSALKNAFVLVNEAFQLMLQHGMTYYTGRCFANVIECEMIVFANMLELLHLWDVRLELNEFYCTFLKINTKSGLNLKNVIIKSINLTGANLICADLSGAHLSYSFLDNANLEGVKAEKTVFENLDMRDTNLSEVKFENATIKNVFLEGAKISKDVFNEKQAAYLNKFYNISEDRVTTTEIDKILHSIRIEYNSFELDNKDGNWKVLTQEEIDLLVAVMNNE